MKIPSNTLYFTQGHKKLRRSLNPDLCVSGAMTMIKCLGLPGTIPVSGSKPAFPGNSSVPGTLGQWVPLSGKYHIKWVQLQEMRSQVTCEVCLKIQVIDHHVCFLFPFITIYPGIKLDCLDVLKTIILIYKSICEPINSGTDCHIGILKSLWNITVTILV